MAPVFGELEGGGIAVLPMPHNFVGCPNLEQNSPGFAIPGAWFGANIKNPTQCMGS